MDQSLNEFVVIVTAQDKQQVPLKQREALRFVGMVEENMVKGVPFEVPATYANLPTLKVIRCLARACMGGHDDSLHRAHILYLSLMPDQTTIA